MAEPSSSSSTQNSISGRAAAVIQTGHVHGGVHVLNTAAAQLPTPRQLPPDVPYFTGRAQELDKLDALLDSGAPSAIVLAGTGGMGKTALAVHWAHRVRDRFPDGDLYVDLRGYDSAVPVTAEQALDGFLRALDVPSEKIPQKIDTLIALYRSLLADRRMLVVLDNAATATQVRPLLPSGSTCTVLVTSRSRLSGLVARDGAHRITLDVMSPGEAGSLLRDIIGTVRFEAALDAAAELARRCAYLPLALRIAADRVVTRPHLAVSDLVEDLVRVGDRLDILAADDDETTAVRSVFSWSYRALPSDAARVFRLLGLHPGPNIGVAAAAALTGILVDAVRRLADVLISVHLLAETGRDRYQFHDLVRAYAAERVTADEHAEATRRVLDWYLHTAVAAKRVLLPNRRTVSLNPPEPHTRPMMFTDREEAMRWYQTERANLLAAASRAAETGHVAAWKLPVALGSILFIGRTRSADLLAIRSAALTAAQELHDAEGELWASRLFGGSLLSLQRFDEAIQHIQRTLALSRQMSERWHEGWAMNDLGFAHLGMGRLPEATAYFDHALVIFRELDNQDGTTTALANLSDALYRQRRFPEAIEHANQALAIARHTNNQWRAAPALHTLGLIYSDLQRIDTALHHLRHALAITRDFGNWFATAQILHSLGTAFRQAGQLHEAEEMWSEALTIFEDLGSPQATEVHAHLEDLTSQRE
jgi:tetratricopeptide (TPR) repeat protein